MCNYNVMPHKGLKGMSGTKLRGFATSNDLEGSKIHNTKSTILRRRNV